MGLKPRRRTDPFLFVGHGFGTSARCLELYLWFATPPARAERAWIAGQLPAPVTSFARFEGALLHAGSDDDLEARVATAYGAGETPGPRAWKAFCADFERAARAIHDRAPLLAVVKPDDGAYGKKLSAWHRRSLAQVGDLITRAEALTSGKRSAWAALVANLREEVRATAEPREPPARRGDVDSKQRLRAALQAIVVPHLRACGFEGSLATLRKIDRRTHLLWFELSSGEYGHLNVGISMLPSRTDTTPAQDYRRAHGPRAERNRKYLSAAATAEEHTLFYYEDAAAAWGDAWPKHVAEQTLRLLRSSKAQRWLGAKL